MSTHVTHLWPIIIQGMVKYLCMMPGDTHHINAAYIGAPDKYIRYISNILWAATILLTKSSSFETGILLIRTPQEKMDGRQIWASYWPRHWSISISLTPGKDDLWMYSDLMWCVLTSYVTSKGSTTQMKTSQFLQLELS